MKDLKMPPQLTRLAMLTVAIVISYFVARFFLVPPSFGKYGWYRGDVLQEYASLPTTYGGQTACLDCHSDVAETKAKGGHKGVSCESCHGPQGAHAADPTSVAPTAMVVDRKFCLLCHEANPTRPEKFPMVNDAAHNHATNCVECHKPHQPKSTP